MLIPAFWYTIDVENATLFTKFNGSWTPLIVKKFKVDDCSQNRDYNRSFTPVVTFDVFVSTAAIFPTSKPDRLNNNFHPSNRYNSSEVL